MLFNSYEFLLAFLPVTLVGFHLALAKLGVRAGILWLILASGFFYGWWNPRYVLLLGASMCVNYVIGMRLSRQAARGRPDRPLLALGIAGNLAVLGYFKYAGFFVDTAGDLFGTDWSIGTILLPLAISFFTFQKIAFLVDSYRGITGEPDFLDYVLFVAFFPQLIAGPIVHYKEVIPQFARMGRRARVLDDLAVGFTIFFIGLFKKTVIADGVAVYSTPVFDAASQGASLTFVEAWGGALAYTFQLYFDFSGYSDMAIGLARMFGIRLPLNFFSPYKAESIVDFWRRWHMTLSRFLRDYLYIPLGGGRRGGVRRYVNLMIVMLLGGLWHGAGWTFVVWGGLHGAYLVINHLWRALRRWVWPNAPENTWWGRGTARMLTFLAVVVGWVFFRAESVGAAMSVLEGMIGANGFVLPSSYGHLLGPAASLLEALGWRFDAGKLPYFYGSFELACFALLLTIVWCAPNTYEIMERYSPALWKDEYQRLRRGWASRLQWRMSSGWAAASGAVAVVALFGMSQVSEFLYFQF